MTEKVKMKTGLPYNSADPEIKSIHLFGKKRIQEFNRVSAEDWRRQREILSGLFGRFGRGARVNQPLWIDYGCNIYLGQDCFINFNCTLLDTGKIIIGDRTLLAPDVKIYTAVHPINGYHRYSDAGTLITQAKPVIIGHDCWIGGGAIILPGVSIGNNVTIGAGSIVTKNIPDNTVAYGNPCRVKRELKED